MKKNLKKVFIVLMAFALAFSVSAKPKKTVVKKIKKSLMNTEASKDIPTSIVALSPSAAEILFAIGAGDQVAAVSEFTDYPEEAKEKPVAGGFDGKALSIETILSFKPDLVYLTQGMHDFLVQPLDEYGISWFMAKGTSIEDIKQEIIEIGKITGHAKGAVDVITDMEKKLKKASDALLQEEAAAEPVTIYYEVWNSPYMSIGSSSFLNDVIMAAGGKNIFDDITEAYPVISEESLIARNPQVILLPAGNGITVEDVQARAGWENIDAVVNGKIYIIDDNLYSRPGPRCADVVLDLSELLK